MEENQILEESQNNQIDYKQDLQSINESINNLFNFFDSNKKEQDLYNKEKEELEKSQQEIELQEQLKLEEEEKQKKELEKKEQEEFYSNIKTISENTSTEVTHQLLSDVSTLMQVNIVCLGLLIGIICISLLAKFFKK